MKQTILAIAAHNDDQVIGAGGTLAKYAGQGRRIRTIVFSFGEMHPYLRKEVMIEKRMREFIKADKIIGGSGVAYFGCRDGHIDEDVKAKNVKKKLLQVLKSEKPSVIFTHGIDDAHPDHRAVNRLIMELIKEDKISCPVYSFDIWSLVKLRKRNLPRMVVDVSDTFPVKIKSFLAHKSQKMVIGALLLKVILKDWFSGLINGYKYAEVFYRLK